MVIMSKQEAWCDIGGFEGHYRVSDLGRIRSLPRLDTVGRPLRERIMSLNTHKNGTYISLRLGGVTSTHLVNRLVAKAFIANTDDLPDVMHIDDNPRNNTIDNLRWSNRSDIVQRSHDTGKYAGVSWSHNTGNRKLSINAVNDIKDSAPTPAVGERLSEKYGVTVTTINNIWDGKTWAH